MMVFFDRLYAMMDKGPLRVLSLILALALAGCIFWNPAAFAAKTSSLEIWHGVLIIWAVCTGVIFGVGFKPIKPRWRILFMPSLAMIIMILGLIYFYG